MAEIGLEIKNDIATPRISVNKLAEYLTTNNPTRRLQIIKDAKQPKKFITTRYYDAREAIKEYISKEFDTGILKEATQRISEKVADTPFQEDDNFNSILALEAMGNVDVFGGEDSNFKRLSNTGNKLMNISGLDVSVNPDLLVSNSKTNKVGAVKIHISKNNILNSESLEYVSVLLYAYLQEIGHNIKEIDTNLCVSVDVFDGNYGICPKSHTRLLNRVSAACEEIVLRWRTLD
jgi:hypothetical protein